MQPRWDPLCRTDRLGKQLTKHLHALDQSQAANVISEAVALCAGCVCVLQMLTLNGGTSDESPVMGAISDLDPNNAYTIMSYMSIKVSSS